MRLRALSNINSGQYNTGDEFEMSDSEAQQLIDAGAAEAASKVTEVTETQVPDGFPQKEEVAPAPAPLEEAVPESPAPEVSQPPVQPQTPAEQPTAAQIAQDLGLSDGSDSSPVDVKVS